MYDWICLNFCSWLVKRKNNHENMLNVERCDHIYHALKPQFLHNCVHISNPRQLRIKVHTYLILFFLVEDLSDKMPFNVGFALGPPSVLSILPPGGESLVSSFIGGAFS